MSWLVLKIICFLIEFNLIRIKDVIKIGSLSHCSINLFFSLQLKILSCVDHDDLKNLIPVSKTIRDAVIYTFTLFPIKFLN